MGQKGHIMVHKGLKMHEKRQKREFLDLKYLLFSGIFLSGIGGYPPPPLNGKVVFDRFPYVYVLVLDSYTSC